MATNQQQDLRKASSRRMYHRPKTPTAAPRSQYGFRSQEWAAESLGTILVAYREAYGKSVDDIAQDLCLRRAHVRALEAGTYGDLPAASYSAGFVRSYAKYLGLPSEEMVARFRDGYSAQAGEVTPMAYTPRVSGATVAYSPRWPSFAVLAIAALLLGASYMVMSAYTRAVDPTINTGVETISSQVEGDDLDISFEIDPLSTELVAVTENPTEFSGTFGYGVPVPQTRDIANMQEAPAPLPVDMSHRVVIRATGYAQITVFDARTGREFLREEYQNGDEYAVPDGQIVSLRSPDVARLEIIVDGVPYRIVSSIARLEGALVLDPDRIENSRELEPIDAL